MGKALEHFYEYDDPYKLLADYLVVNSGPIDIALMLRDDECIFRKVKKEFRNQDFKGPFTDCIITEIYRNKERMELMHALDSVGHYLFSKLDLTRLREEIVSACEELGIFLENEPTDI